ncbi:MAG: hypothetical protein AAGK22_15520 [Acidobacteriota bacterium]
MSESQQRIVLAVLGLILVVIVGLRVLPALRGSGGERWWQQGGSRAVFDDELDVEVLELQTRLLRAEPREFAVGRDPWRFGEAPKPPAPKPKPPAPKPKKQPKPKPPKPVETGPVEPPKPKPPEVDVTFLGTFGPADRKIAVFFDGSAIYNAGRGDVLNEKFQVVEIGLESVDLGFVGFPDEPPARLAIGG